MRGNKNNVTEIHIFIWYFGNFWNLQERRATVGCFNLEGTVSLCGSFGSVSI